jgi:hypothetical protein
MDARLVKSLLALIKALGEHEGMRNNNAQTYMTPAKHKNAQYFAWDFVRRTIVSVSFFGLLSFRCILWSCASISKALCMMVLWGATCECYRFPLKSE